MRSLLLLLAIAVTVGDRSGTVEGSVENEDGGPVIAAEIGVRNVMSGTVGRTTTDGKGWYQIEGLRPGRYRVWAKAPAHTAVYKEHVCVEAGQVVRVDFTLTRGIASSKRDEPEPTCAAGAK